jgi:hypothetical protein
MSGRKKYSRKLDIVQGSEDITRFNLLSLLSHEL